MAKSICGACDETFTSVSAFDMHRVGNFGEPLLDNKGKLVGYGKSQRRCLSAEEMRVKGMTQTEKGWWTTGQFKLNRTTDTEIEEEEELEVPAPDEEIAS